MVLPRPRCLTCKKRRVKCDSGRPACTPCRRGCRTCIWDAEEETDSPFRSENAFAQGQPRRPRKPTAPRTPRDVVHVTQSSASPTPSLSIPIEQHAFHFFAQNFTIFPGDVPDIGHDYLTYALDYWDRAPQDSSLRQAFLAFSLAAFGQVTHTNRALEDADRLYNKSIVKMRTEIQGVSAGRIEQLIVTTLLMTNYETFTYKAKELSSQNATPAQPNEVGSRLWRFARHWEGAAGLLLVRQQLGLTQDVPVCRAARRPMIRGYILRGEPVPSWLQDGAEFGEEGPTLTLDSLMVRTASIRSQWLKLLPHKQKATSWLSVRDLAAAATDLDLDLASWCLGLPEEWQYSIHSPVEPSLATEPELHDAAIYSYSTLGHAAVWMRYYAVRLVVSSICMRLFTTLASTAPPGNTWGKLKTVCQENIVSIAVDMCRSIPFFFHLGARHGTAVLASSCGGSSATGAEPDISPRVAILLTWPLAVAVSTEAIPKAEKKWMQRTLKTAARIQGDGVLQTIAEKEEFKF